MVIRLLQPLLYEYRLWKQWNAPALRRITWGLKDIRPHLIGGLLVVRLPLPPQQEPRLDLPDPLHHDPATQLADELPLDGLVGFPRDLDPADDAVRLHAAGHVHGVAPQVVGDLVQADH